MDLQTLEDLLDELLNGIQDVIQSGEVLSDEFQGILAQELQYLTSAIDELQQQNPVEQLSPTIAKPKIEPAGYPSAQINGFNYDPQSKQLLVKFQGDYPQENGPVYSYSDVPDHIFKLFSRGAVAPKTSGKNAWHEWKQGLAPSLGASMNALIKGGGYAYQRLS